MMKHVLAAAISSAALLMASGALADGGPAPEPPPPPPPVYEPPPPPVYNWYTTIFAGVAFGGDLDQDLRIFDPQDPAFDEIFTITQPLNTGYLLGWTIGYDNIFGGDSWFQFRPEVELSFRQRDVDFDELFADFDFDFFDNDPFENFSDPADTLALMFNGWFDFRFDGFEPYIGGGLGVGWSDMPSPGALLPSFESTDFVWQAGAGFNFDVSERVFIGIGYRYFSGGFDKDISFFIDPPFVVLPDPPIIALEVPINFDFNYDTHEVMMNLGVRF